MIGLYLKLRRKLFRLRQWRAVLKLEGSNAKLWPMIQALRSGAVSAEQYRERLRHGCAKCPVYDKGLRACRKVLPGGYRINTEPDGYQTIGEPIPDTHLGCGCYVPYLAKTRAPYQGNPPGRQPGQLRSGVPGPIARGCWGRVVMGPPFGWGDTPEPKADPEATFENIPLVS